MVLGPERVDLGPERVELALRGLIQGLIRQILGQRANFRFMMVDFRLGRANISSERVDFGPKRADMRSKKGAQIA